MNIINIEPHVDRNNLTELINSYILDILTHIPEDKRSKEKTIIFFKTKKDCEQHYEALKKVCNHSLMLHGEISNDERKQIIQEFKKSGESLFSTDLIERGIDIKTVKHIIHVNLPPLKTYLNRNGRALRNQKKDEFNVSHVYVLSTSRCEPSDQFNFTEKY